jgi:hypothetical protein
MQVQIIAENIMEGGNRTKKKFVVALVFTALKNACVTCFILNINKYGRP